MKAIQAKSLWRYTRLAIGLILIAATRGMLGAGIALLVSRRLTDQQRETAGIILTAIGILTTFPLAAEALGKSTLKQPDIL